MLGTSLEPGSPKQLHFEQTFFARGKLTSSMAGGQNLSVLLPSYALARYEDLLNLYPASLLDSASTDHLLLLFSGVLG